MDFWNRARTFADEAAKKSHKKSQELRHTITATALRKPRSTGCRPSPPPTAFSSWEPISSSRKTGIWCSRLNLSSIPPQIDRKDDRLSIPKMVKVHRISSVEWNPSPVVALATSADSSQVAAARADGSLEIWLVSHGCPLRAACATACCHLLRAVRCTTHQRRQLTGRRRRHRLLPPAAPPTRVACATTAGAAAMTIRQLMNLGLRNRRSIRPFAASRPPSTTVATLCTACVLRHKPGSFCPVCFDVYDDDTRCRVSTPEEMIAGSSARPRTFKKVEAEVEEEETSDAESEEESDDEQGSESEPQKS